MSGSAFIQSVAATIGPPSGGRIGADVRAPVAPSRRVEPVPALHLERVAPEQRERRRAVDLGRDPELLGEQSRAAMTCCRIAPGADEPDARMRVSPELSGAAANR